MCAAVKPLVLGLLVAGLGGDAFSAVPCPGTETIDCGMHFFREIYEQFQTVQSEVAIMPYFITPRMKIFSSVEGQPPDLTLTDLIIQALKRGVHVYILGWDNSASEKFLGFHQDHEYQILFEAAGKDSEYLHLMLDTGRRVIASVYYLPHIKSYAFDRKVAYVGGIDFVENRLDTPQHIRPNPLLVKVPVDERHPTGNQKPWQDTMIKVTGAVAQHVAMVLIERWWTYCASEGYVRSEFMRPMSAVLDNIMWHVKDSMQVSEWKKFQCSHKPAPAVLGVLDISIAGGENTPRQHQVTIMTPQVQSSGLEANPKVQVSLRSGQHLQVKVTGFQALDKNVPGELRFEVDGVILSSESGKKAILQLSEEELLTAEWLPNGVRPGDFPDGQHCQLTLSGSNMWLGTTSHLKESYDEFINMIQNAKRFIFIENQYFSTDVPSHSKECGHEHDRTSQLYSGAKNVIGKVLMDRIKRAALAKEHFSVVVIIPLATEPGSFYPNLRGTYCFEEAIDDFWRAEKLQSDRKDYFSFFFLANAVAAPVGMQGPGNAFYGIFMHTKVIVVDDEVAYIGSANINDRSLLGNRDAEVGVTVRGGSYPRELRETLLDSQLGGPGKVDTSRFASSVGAVAKANADELRRTMGISFPDGTVTSKNNGTIDLFGMENLINHAPNREAALKYPLSRVVGGGGGSDHFEWFVVPDDHFEPPKLQGTLFPWSRSIWGMPQLTSIAQIFSNELNYVERPEESSTELGPVLQADKPLFL